MSNPAPRYPYLSRSREEEGRVILQVYVNKKGRASRIETIQSSGHSRLDKAARKAVNKLDIYTCTRRWQSNRRGCKGTNLVRTKELI